MATSNEYRLRPLIIRYNNVTNPDGSALLCQGNTVVQIYVYGPSEILMSRERSDKAFLSVVFKPKNSCNKYGPQQEFIQDFIRNALESVILLEMHPRTGITVIIQEIQDDGCMLSAALNGACCALLDAGIPMKCLITAVSFEFNEKGEILLDPETERTADSIARLVLTYDSINSRVLSMINEGTLTVDQIKSCLKIGRKASEEIVSFYHDSMKKRFLLT